ncbi:endonuclease domain-containing protein [Fodinibius salsisoli]|uniref:DUF559 domain-containing protein n=1 Tax=Fodinibius salsisoli TaxID=2820877 RepID=A0ABT3PRB7_9BACT|nr:DUF559 domain-containing protein [Fodinibius salsisoli]MCW9708409.1 DUF559 domain-containing protein [Fodinibius salsisoli]
MSYIKYNPKLKKRARKLRKNSTSSEIELWKALRAGKFLGYTFNRQKPLDEYIVDFYCKSLHLVIEVDGESHDGKKEYDQNRQQRLESLGLTVVRFYDHEVINNIGGVLEKLEKMIQGLNKKHGVPPSKGGQGDLKKEE